MNTRISFLMGRRLFLPLSGLLLASSVTLREASAQERTRSVLPPVPPVQALDMVARGEKGASLIIAAFEADKVEAGRTRLGNRTLYSDADRQMLLDGIEQMAMGGPGDSLSIRNRGRLAIEVLTHLGIHSRAEVPESQEIPSRTLRILRQSTDPYATVSALRLLGLLLAFDPSERREISEALYHSASNPEGLITQGFAVEVLLSACEAGLPALHRLAREGVVTEPVTEAWFRILLEKGFPREEMVRYRGGEPCPPGG